MRRRARVLLGVAAAAVSMTLAGAAAAQRTYLLVVSGLGGDEARSQSFHHWSLALVDAALAAGVPPDQVRYLAEDPARAPDRISGRATRESVLLAIAELGGRAAAEDTVWLVLIGHGSAAQGSARFNLAGPDLSDADLLAALGAVAARVAVVNTASASGGFLAPLSYRGRAVVTATKSAAQQNETMFARPFVEAFAGLAGDADKDGRVSLLEAFDFARRAVAEHYQKAELMVTEHAHLDDNGDGVGSQAPDPLAVDPSVDGRLAGRLYLAQATSSADSPALHALLRDKAAIEERLDDLRRQRGAIEEELYLSELERLLVELAQVDERIAAARRGESDE